MWDKILRQAAQTGQAKGTLPEPTVDLLEEVWPTLVGDQIARVSSPRGLRDRILYIATREKALVDEWRRSPAPLLRRILQSSPWPIEKLSIDHDPSAGRRIATTPTKFDTAESANGTPPSDEITPELCDIASDVDGIDDELASILGAIARHRHKRRQ